MGQGCSDRRSGAALLAVVVLCVSPSVRSQVSRSEIDAEVTFGPRASAWPFHLDYT